MRDDPRTQAAGDVVRELVGARSAPRYVGLESRVNAVLGRLKAELRTSFDRWWDTWIEPEFQEAETG